MMRNEPKFQKEIDRIIRRVWTEYVADDYQKNLINSERALQASLYFHLRKALSERVGIFVEPKFDGENLDKALERKVPDIVLCHEHIVLSILELKFVPESRPSFERDFEKIRLYKNHAGSKLYLRVEPDTGWWQGASKDNWETFTIQKNVLCYFGLISRWDSAVFYPEKLKKRKACMVLERVVILEGKVHYENEQRRKDNAKWEFSSRSIWDCQ